MNVEKVQEKKSVHTHYNSQESEKNQSEWGEIFKVGGLAAPCRH